MRYFLAVALLTVAIPAAASDWKFIRRTEFQMGIVSQYVDLASVKEKSGHRLAWIKYTEIRKDDPTKTEGPNALFLMEFDCDGRWLMHKKYEANLSRTSLEEVPEKNLRREWVFILPDTDYEAYEKAVCGK